MPYRACLLRCALALSLLYLSLPNIEASSFRNHFPQFGNLFNNAFQQQRKASTQGSSSKAKASPSPSPSFDSSGDGRGKEYRFQSSSIVYGGGKAETTFSTQDLVSGDFEYQVSVNDPDVLIEHFKDISLKLTAGQTLTVQETLEWKSVAPVMYAQLKTPDCDTFFSDVEQEDAACCKVLVSGKYFGFCTLVRLLQDYGQPMSTVRTTGHKRMIYGAHRQARFDSRSLTRIYVQWENNEMATANSLSGHSYRSYYHHTLEVPTPVVDVVYIDLFAVPCNPPLDDGLCSQYCCSADHNSGSFCNSKLECY